MRYWLYNEGNIDGPYEAEQLLAQSSFSPSSLVCEEISGGTKADDWKTAGEIGEFSSLFKINLATASHETPGFSEYGEERKDPDGEMPEASYSNLLDSIDGLLKGFKNEEGKKEKPKINYEFDVVDKFDIKIAKIQEDLESARWEKNVLIERLRLKESEERKDKDRIKELEKKLTGILKRLERDDKVVYVEGGDGEKEKKEISEKLEKIKEINERQAAEIIEKAEEAEKSEKNKTAKIKPVRADDSYSQPKSLKSLKKEEIKNERLIDMIQEVQNQQLELKSGSLKKFVAPETSYTDSASSFSESGGDTNGSALSFSPETAPRSEPLKPLPMQESGLVYDFTVVTPKKEGERINFNIEPSVQHFQQPAPYVQSQSQAQQPQPAPYIPQQQFQAQQQPAPQPRQTAPSFGQEVKPQTFDDPNAAMRQAVPHFEFKAPKKEEEKPQPSAEKAGTIASISPAEPKAPEGTKRSLDATIRLAGGKKSSAENEAKKSYPKPKTKIKFLVTLLVFAVIAVGGIYYFIAGGKTGVEQIAVAGMRGGKQTTLEDKGPLSGSAPVKEPPPLQQTQSKTVASAAAIQSAAQPKEEKNENVSENVKKSIDIVKNYALSGGRGTISSWFSNSFSNNKQVNEEWNSTLLQGKVFVVQYRLIRPKQEPLVYQFEVDVEKGSITRGINNNAIELLEASLKKEEKKAALPKPVKESRIKKKSSVVAKRTPAVKTDDSLLPLPEEENSGYSEPTGFENSDTINGKVKVTAPETDEELF